MQDTVIPVSIPLPSRWSVVPPIAAAWLVLGIYSAAGFILPALWEWQSGGVVAIILMGASAGWIAPLGRQRLAFGVLAASLGVLTLFCGSEWFYYSPIFIPVALVLVWGVLATGYVGGLFLRRFRVNRYALLVILGCVLLVEVTALYARDGYLLIR